MNIWFPKNLRHIGSNHRAHAARPLVRLAWHRLPQQFYLRANAKLRRRHAPSASVCAAKTSAGRNGGVLQRRRHLNRTAGGCGHRPPTVAEMGRDQTTNLPFSSAPGQHYLVNQVAPGFGHYLQAMPTGQKIEPGSPLTGPWQARVGHVSPSTPPPACLAISWPMGRSSIQRPAIPWQTCS